VAHSAQLQGDATSAVFRFALSAHGADQNRVLRARFLCSREGLLTSEPSEIVLTDTAGELLQVDALAYPEDTYLIVDPYSGLEEPDATMNGLVAEAETILPRPLGEIITARAEVVKATWLLRLVLLDFNRQRHCRAEQVEETLSRLIWQVAHMKVQCLGLDRFELLEPCISAYRVVSCLRAQLRNVEAAGSSPPPTLMFSIQQPATLRHYQVALANLP